MRWLANLTLVNWLHIKDSPFSAIGTVIICLCCLSAFIFSHDAMAGTLVVVPPGLEEVEGNSSECSQCSSGRDCDIAGGLACFRVPWRACGPECDCRHEIAP